MQKSLSVEADLPLVPGRGQSVLAACSKRLAPAVLPQPQPACTIRRQRTISRAVPGSLLRHKFRVAIRHAIGFGRSTLRFATLLPKIRKLTRLSEARLWRGTHQA